MSTVNRFEQGKTVGVWTLVASMDRDLAAPLWIGDDRTRVAYVRNFRVRSVRVSERLSQVAAWAAGYEHNSILPMLELVDVEGSIAVVSHYEEGQLLSSVIAKAILARKPLAPGVAVSLVLDVLEALDATGGRLAPAWAHGGVRPESVLVTRGGRARVMELGATSVLADAEPLSRETKWAAYSAPEQIAHQKADAKSDVFSTAALLWEMLVNRSLFMARTHADVKKKLVEEPIERADARARTRVPAKLADVLELGLHRSTTDRFETAKAFANALRGACDEVAERHEVSEYLEQLHVVALDTRRRSLQQLLGRQPPVSVPPAPRDNKPRKLASVAPPPPPVPKFATPARAREQRPAQAKISPAVQAKPVAESTSARTPSVAPIPLTRVSEPAPEIRVQESEPPQDERASDDVDLSFDFEPDRLAGAMASDPLPSEEVAVEVDGELSWSSAGSSEPPPSEDVAPTDERNADAAPVSEPQPGMDVVAPSDAPSESEPVVSVDVAVSSDAPSDAVPTRVTEPSAQTVEVRKEPQPAPLPPAAARAPSFDALLDEPIGILRPQRRWPTLLVGMVIGSGVTYAVMYGAQPRPSPPAPAPTQAAPLPEPAPTPSPEPIPTATEASSQDAAEGAPSASSGQDSKRKRPTPRPRKARPPPTATPDWVAPRPAPQGEIYD